METNPDCNTTDAGQQTTDEYTGWCYDFSRELKLKYFVDVSDNKEYIEDNFVKSIRMSPTGCSFIFSSEDGMVRYVNIRDIDFWGVQEETSEKYLLHTSRCFNHTETAYDIEWVPLSNKEFFISSCKDTPIRLWDVESGQVSIYKTYNSKDEIINAFSVHASRDASLIMGGYKGHLSVYAVERPGLAEWWWEDKSVGLISTVSDCVDGCIGIGSYNGGVVLLDRRLCGDGYPLWQQRIGNHGIHQVSFLQQSPLLLINERYSGVISVWDRRNLSASVFSVSRTSGSQQRFEVSVSADEQWFASGDREGKVRVWNMRGEVVYEQCIYKDAIPAVCFHPYNPILVCGTGERHFDADVIPSCCLLYQIPWKYWKATSTFSFCYKHSIFIKKSLIDSRLYPLSILALR